MSRFVICIDDRQSGGALRRGEVYRVAATYANFIAVEDGRLNGWFSSRFKPAPDIAIFQMMLGTRKRDRLKHVPYGCPLAERLVFHSIDQGDCRVWTGSRSDCGYGKLMYRGRSMTAHRLAWEDVNGPIPPGLLVLHSCDNPPCIRVEHLFLGSDQANSDDKVAKGRQAFTRGEINGGAKLTEADVRRIRASSGVLREVAEKYNVTTSTVWDIRTRKTWRHLSDSTPAGTPAHQGV